MAKGVHRLFLLCLILTFFGEKGHGEEVYHTLTYLYGSSVDYVSGDHLPFFMTANRNGVLSPQGSQGYIRGAIAYKHQKEDKKSYWGAGADLIGYASSHDDYYRNNAYLQQIYAEIGGGQYFLTLGSKERPARFVNPELSSGNMAWSNNMRPVPGIHFGTNDFVKMFIIADLLESSFDLFYGKMLDGRYNRGRFDQYALLGNEGPLRASGVEGAYLHKKSVFFRTPSKMPFYITAGIEHIAVFGGKIRHIDGVWDPSREMVYFNQTCKWGNALFGGEGNTEDALNHLMTLNVRLDFKHEKFSLAAYKQHYTDDLNSKSFTNYADGLWGVELKLRRTPWLGNLVIEYIKTNSQGDNTQALQKLHAGEEVTVEDFASDFYQDERFGAFSYYGMLCGNPMIASPIYNEDHYPGLLHNNIQGFHVGASGAFSRDLAYKVKYCSITSEGNPWTSAMEHLAGRSTTKSGNDSFLLELTYNYSDWEFSSQISLDRGELLGNNFGFGLTACYRGRLMKAVWK